MAIRERIALLELEAELDKQDKCLYCGQAGCPEAREWRGTWRAGVREVRQVFTQVNDEVMPGVH